MFGWFKKKKKTEAPAPSAPTPGGARARVTFEDDDTTVEVELGARLPDVCDDEGLSLAFGCREGGCGTCLIEVLDGMASLSVAEPTEREMLDIMAEGRPNARLACQCVVRGDFRFRSLDA